MTTDAMILHLAEQLYAMQKLHGLTVYCVGDGCTAREIGVPVGRVDAEMARCGWSEAELRDDHAFAGWLCPCCTAEASQLRRSARALLAEELVV